MPVTHTRGTAHDTWADTRDIEVGDEGEDLGLVALPTTLSSPERPDDGTRVW
jgi:hypothetical protein